MNLCPYRWGMHGALGRFRRNGELSKKTPRGASDLLVCASCAPVAQQVRGLVLTAMDLSGLTAGVADTAASVRSRAASEEAALRSGGGGI
jgi:hypothetical protein